MSVLYPGKLSAPDRGFTRHTKVLLPDPGPLHMTINLGVETRGKTNRSAKSVTEGFPYLRDELGSMIIDNVLESVIRDDVLRQRTKQAHRWVVRGFPMGTH